MLDWQKLVRERLSRLSLDAAEREDVCAELASHLEDDYHLALASDASESAAYEAAMRRVGDWRDLQTQIESARKKEPPMNDRVRQFWFPALLTIFLAMVFLMVIEELGPKPWVSPAWGGPPRIAPVAVVYFSWLATLPLIGALGAWLSRRAGGHARTVFSSVIFPVLPYLAFFLVGLPVSVILDDHVAHNIMLSALFVGFAAWVVLPAVALLAGGLSVQLLSNHSRARVAS